MTLRDALAAALLAAYIDPATGRVTVAALVENMADHALADPAFRAALTKVAAEALDAEEEDVGFPVMEAWPSAAAIVARMLGETT
jgi:hypothetical protein